MSTFFSTYTYMSFSLLLLVIWTICWWQSGSQRQAVLMSSLFAAPFGFLSVFFVPNYWNPVRLIEFGAGFEDLFFSFASGGIAWFCATLPFRKQIRINLNLARLFRVYIVTCLIGFTFGGLLDTLGSAPMTITLIGFTFTVVIFVKLRGELWQVLIAGGCLFGLFYLVICLLAFNLQPEFIQQWNLKALSDILWFGTPIEELGWGIGFGAVWPLIFGYSVHLRITDPLVAETNEQRLFNEILA
jgi:hypothetical protein